MRLLIATIRALSFVSVMVCVMWFMDESHSMLSRFLCVGVAVCNSIVFQLLMYC